jgi:hypothetical protein
METRSPRRFWVPSFVGSLLLIGACSGGQTNDSARTLQTGKDDVNAGDGEDAGAGEGSDEDSLPEEETDAGREDGGSPLDADSVGPEAALPTPETVGTTLSGFDNDDQGWTITGDAQGTSAKPDFNGTGGNPDGLISAKDNVAGGTWYFSAPAKYLGDQSAAFGGTLSFDLKTTPITSPFANSDVLLEAGALILSFDLPQDPGTDWTHYVVPLDASGWTSRANDAGTLSPEAFRMALSQLSALRIRGEYQSGPDTGSLDNVRLTAP